MDVKDLSVYLKLSVSAIYKLTSTSEIPHYKSGKRLYFKKEDIDEWIFSHRIKTRDDIEKEAMEYIKKIQDDFSLEINNCSKGRIITFGGKKEVLHLKCHSFTNATKKITSTVFKKNTNASQIAQVIFS